MTTNTDERTYTIKYYLGGDWKFLALVTGKVEFCVLCIQLTYICFTEYVGIDSTTREYSCIWCKCPSKEWYNPEKRWSLSDNARGARTTEENLTLATGTRKKFNVSHPPLFTSIPLENVVIDNLHLFLRVSDVLIDLILESLIKYVPLATLTSTDTNTLMAIKPFLQV